MSKHTFGITGECSHCGALLLNGKCTRDGDFTDQEIAFLEDWDAEVLQESAVVLANTFHQACDEQIVIATRVFDQVNYRAQIAERTERDMSAA